jgi:hypothetical protein
MRAVTAILLAPFAILALEWSLREAPPSCADDDAWLAGLAPAAFVTGCICLTVQLRVSALRRGGRAGPATLTGAALWLVLAVVWWAGGSLYLLPVVPYLLLLPAVPAVATLAAINFVRPTWTIVTAIAWLGAFVLVPGGVVVVETWGGVNFYC